MKIKGLTIAFILCMAAVTRLHSFGVGLQVNLRAGDIFAPGIALAFSPSSKTHIAANWNIAADELNIIGLTLDAVPLALPLVSSRMATFNFTLGVGLYANMVFQSGSDNGFNGGVRVPIGFNVMLLQNVLEVYTHVAPSFGVDFIPSIGFAKPFFPIALGVRLWI